MNALKSILLNMYLITMVLLPYGHMPFHHASTALASEQHQCGGQGECPESADTSEDCSVCSLTLLFVEAPPAPQFTAIYTITETVNFPAIVRSDAQIAQQHRARAPPTQTV